MIVSTALAIIKIRETRGRTPEKEVFAPASIRKSAREKKVEGSAAPEKIIAATERIILVKAVTLRKNMTGIREDLTQEENLPFISVRIDDDQKHNQLTGSLRAAQKRRQYGISRWVRQGSKRDA